MIIEAAINEARDALFQRGVTDVTDIDALVEMAQRSLATVESPARRDRFRTNIHLRTDGTACDAHGWNLPDAIRQYITCDGLLSPVFVDGSIPISVGRTQRMIPQRTRLLVLLRDQGCTVPGCNEAHFLEVHHIVHWENGGPTDTWNLITLCSRHHRMHHRGELGITGNADTLGRVKYTNRHGRPLGSTGAEPKPPGAAPPTPDGVYEHPLGERLDERWLYFNPHPNTANGPGTNTRTTPFAPADPAARLDDHPTAEEPGKRSLLDVDHDRGVARSGAGDGRQVDDPPSGSKAGGQGHGHRFGLFGEDRAGAGRLAGVDRPKAYLDLGVERRQERRARRRDIDGRQTHRSGKLLFGIARFHLARTRPERPLGHREPLVAGTFEQLVGPSRAAAASAGADEGALLHIIQTDGNFSNSMLVLSDGRAQLTHLPIGSFTFQLEMFDGNRFDFTTPRSTRSGIRPLTLRVPDPAHSTNTRLRLCRQPVRVRHSVTTDVSRSTSR